MEIQKLERGTSSNALVTIYYQQVWLVVISTSRGWHVYYALFKWIAHCACIFGYNRRKIYGSNNISVHVTPIAKLLFTQVNVTSLHALFIFIILNNELLGHLELLLFSKASL